MLLCFEGLDGRSQPCMLEGVSMRPIGEDLRSISGCLLLNGISMGARKLAGYIELDRKKRRMRE